MNLKKAMKIYETLSSHHQEDLETLDNIDYLARICEQLNEWDTVEILRRQAIELRVKIFTSCELFRVGPTAFWLAVDMSATVITCMVIT